MDTQLGFWHQLGCQMVENTLDEETDAGGVERRRPRSMGGTW